MSLINDALKKSGNNKINPRGVPPLEPAEPKSEGSSGGGKGFTIFLICFVLAGGAALGAWKYWNTKYKGVTGDSKAGTNATAKAAAPNTNNNPIARATAAFNKVFDRNNEGESEAAAVNAKPPVTRIVIGPDGQPTKTTEPPPTSSSSPVLLKAKPKSAWVPGMPRVQAIFYKEQDAAAIIDGKTVRAGDRLGDNAVLEIRKDSVLMRIKDENVEVPMR